MTKDTVGLALWASLPPPSPRGPVNLLGQPWLESMVTHTRCHPLAPRACCWERPTHHTCPPVSCVLQVEHWGPFDLVYGCTPHLGQACDRPPGKAAPSPRAQAFSHPTHTSAPAQGQRRSQIDRLRF